MSQAQTDQQPPRARGQLLRTFKEGGGYVSVCVYRNVAHGMVFYDTVLYRKVRNPEGQGQHYIRGANFKPDDLPILQRLLHAASEFIADLTSR